ncbi:MAG: hypothetical protein ACREL7_09930 [Longimicrobiales bacterium]
MPSVGWNATVADSPGSEPYAVVGDLVLAVRTPRSRDFVTVEVAPASMFEDALSRGDGVVLAPTPSPRFTHQWHGELHVGTTVGFQVAGESYRLTLARLAESPAGLPWVVCDFRLERD